MEQNIQLWNEVYDWNKSEQNFLVFPDEELIRVVKKRFHAGGVQKVLDLGCGSGRHAVYMLSEGLDVTGIDASDHAIDICRERCKALDLNGKFVVEDIAKGLPFETDEFDAVVNWGVLHYLTSAETETVLTEICRILKPGGQYLLTLRSAEDSECHENSNEMQSSSADESKGMKFRYFDEVACRDFLRRFDEVNLGHKTRTILGDLNRNMAHWFIHCLNRS